MLTPVAALFLIGHSAAGQLSLTTAQIARKVGPSVVVIEGQTDSGDLLGSGFIVSNDGKVVTNLHVIRNLRTASVRSPRGEIFSSVFVLATDERRDIAILQIAGLSLPPLEMGDSNATEVGERVVVVGNPRGLEGTVTEGVLSSIRDVGDGSALLQTDAAVNSGNSGGPLVNSNAQAIGVVSFKLRSSEGLNFAIPINCVRGLLKSLHPPITLEQMRRDLGTGEAARGASTSPTSPSLKETLDWLKQKIPLGRVRYSYSFNGKTRLQTIQPNSWALDSCTITVGSESVGMDITTDKQGAYPITFQFRYTVPLGLITGIAVKQDDHGLESSKAAFVGGDRWEYRVVLTAASKTIMEQGQIAQVRTSDIVDSFYLPFSDESLAHRVSEAFRHATDLCKAKEPF